VRRSAQTTVAEKKEVTATKETACARMALQDRTVTSGHALTPARNMESVLKGNVSVK